MGNRIKLLELFVFVCQPVGSEDSKAVSACELHYAHKMMVVQSKTFLLSILGVKH